MNSYNFIFIWLAIFALFISRSNVMVSERVCGKCKKRISVMWACIIFAPIFILAVYGNPIGDTPVYLSSYNAIEIGQEEIRNYLNSDVKEKGFYIFQVLIKIFFGENQLAFRFILGAIHALPVILIFRKYSENYLISVYLFVATTCHIGWMMNGLRQFMAVTIIFATTPLILKKKYLPLIVIILMASTIHLTALLMIPVVFVVQGKTWNKRTMLTIVIAVVATYLFSRYTGLIDILLEGTDYEGSVSMMMEMGDDGTNPIRVLVNAIPMIMAFLGRKQIETDSNPMINLCINMSVITTGLYLVSMVTSGILLGRLPIYTSLYNMILLPNIIPKIFTKQSEKLVMLLMMVFYLGYYCYSMGFI